MGVPLFHFRASPPPPSPQAKDAWARFPALLLTDPLAALALIHPFWILFGRDAKGKGKAAAPVAPTLEEAQVKADKWMEVDEEVGIGERAAELVASGASGAKSADFGAQEGVGAGEGRKEDAEMEGMEEDEEGYDTDEECDGEAPKIDPNDEHEGWLGLDAHIIAAVNQHFGLGTVKAQQAITALKKVRDGSHLPNSDSSLNLTIRRILIDVNKQIYQLDADNPELTAKIRAAYPLAFDAITGLRKLGNSPFTGANGLANITEWTTAEEDKYRGGGMGGFGAGGVGGVSHATENIVWERGWFQPGIEHLNAVSAAFPAGLTGQSPYMNVKILPTTHLDAYKAAHFKILKLMLEAQKLIVYNGGQARIQFLGDAISALNLQVETVPIPWVSRRDGELKTAKAAINFIHLPDAPLSDASPVVTRVHPSNHLLNVTEQQNVNADLEEGLVRKLAPVQIDFPELAPDFHYQNFKPSLPDDPFRQTPMHELSSAATAELEAGHELDRRLIEVSWPGLNSKIDSDIAGWVGPPPNIALHIPLHLWTTRIQRARAIQTARSVGSRARNRETDRDPASATPEARAASNKCRLQRERKKQWKLDLSSSELRRARLTCDHCPKVFNSEKVKEDHECGCEHNPDPLAGGCQYCGVKYAYGSSRDAHEIICTSNPDAQPITCQHCGESYAGESYKDDHEAGCESNPERAPKFLCKYCKKSYSDSSNLKRHEKGCPVRPALVPDTSKSLCLGCKELKGKSSLARHEGTCAKYQALPDSEKRKRKRGPNKPKVPKASSSQSNSKPEPDSDSDSNSKSKAQSKSKSKATSKASSSKSNQNNEEVATAFITKINTHKLYRLNDSDLERLPFVKSKSSIDYTYYLYNEIDVERIPWTKPGSPELRRLGGIPRKTEIALYEKSRHNPGNFPAPGTHSQRRTVTVEGVRRPPPDPAQEASDALEFQEKLDKLAAEFSARQIFDACVKSLSADQLDDWEPDMRKRARSQHLKTLEKAT
ncbi:hypothetical protein P7C70_g4617, partial [Phenoliferia sp. Uapishka_3]